MGTDMMVDFTKDMLKKIVECAFYFKKSSIDFSAAAADDGDDDVCTRRLQTAAQLCLPGELQGHAVKLAAESVNLEKKTVLGFEAKETEQAVLDLLLGSPEHGIELIPVPVPMPAVAAGTATGEGCLVSSTDGQVKIVTRRCTDFFGRLWTKKVAVDRH
jgi:hypothetical protein